MRPGGVIEIARVLITIVIIIMSRIIILTAIKIILIAVERPRGIVKAVADRIRRVEAFVSVCCSIFGYNFISKRTTFSVYVTVSRAKVATRKVATILTVV